jgi:RimJ/RimL family protein N-acetyltransferase
MAERGDLTVLHEPFGNLKDYGETDAGGQTFGSPVPLLAWLRGRAHRRFPGRPCCWMICVTSPMTLTVKLTATVPALTLRSWQDSDIPAIVAAYRDEAMRRWLVSSVDDEVEARAWLARQDAGWADGTRLSWAIEKEGTVVGGFVIKAASPPETLATGVGYWTAAEARGTGIASRCVETATEWLFGGQGIRPADEIELLHTVGNEGSCRVAQKCGYVLESVLAPMPPKFPDEGHRHLRRRPA